MVGYEIIEILQEETPLTPQEIVEMLSSITNDVEGFKEELKEYAIDKEICPICGKDLSISHYQEDMGEHFGTPAYETFSKFECDCGWVNA